MSGLPSQLPRGPEGQPETAGLLRVAYREDPAVGMKVNLIHRWARGDIDSPVMSASSGPKDYTRNHIWSIFDRYEWVAAVLMVRGQYSQIGQDKHPSPPFLLLVSAEGRVFDMAGKEVIASWEAL